MLAFESILYGLIVSRILIQWNKMIQERGHYSFYWAHLLLTVEIFLFIVYVYLMNYSENHYAGMNEPLAFLIYLVIPPSLFTFSSYQMFPKKISNTDFREYLYTNSRIIILPLLVFGVIFTSYMSRDSIGLSTRAVIAYAILTAGGITLFLMNKRLMSVMIVLAFLFIFYLYLFPFI